ncbi:MAG: MATE family efflux transporter [Huintestinicola sp.]|uniref:MATE family efflux transporter n=1 Tax=Huintestinicola sp. TaxID=2981661 RepID=UPI003F091427
MEKTEKMGSLPIGRLMLSMSVPMVISMILQAVYNIVDSAFVSNMAENGEAALNALTLAFPLQMLMVAVGIGTGVGVNALTAKSLGAGDREKASRTAGNGIFLAGVIYVIFMLFGIFGSESYIFSQTDNPLIGSMAADYLRICCIFSFGIVFFSIYEKLLQAGGHSGFSTIAQISGALVNIVLDPVLIYGLGAFPEMGVRGAAVATVAGQAVSFILALIFHFKVNTGIDNKLSFIKPSLTVIKEIYSIGFPAVVAQALMSAMTYGLNIVFGTVSENMVTAYGLYYKIQQVVLFIAFGIRDAITPVVSFNYGMGSRKRIDGGIKWGMLFTEVMMVAGLAVIELFALPLAQLFGLSGETEQLCISAMRIISVSFVFAGANVAFQGIFQALDGGGESLIVSICRQLLFIFPPALFFADMAKKNSGLCSLVWTSFPIAELLSVIVALLLFRSIYRKRVAMISDEPSAALKHSTAEQ